MGKTTQDVLDCLEGTSEDQVVALIKAIYALKGKNCGGCGKSPCCCAGHTVKTAPKTGCGCNSNPCSCCSGCGCSPCSCCSGCNASPCCCDPCRPNMGDYLLELGRLNLCFYEQLFEVNKKFHTTLSSAFCAPTACAPACCTSCNSTPCCCGPTEAQKTLCIEGSVGSHALGVFTITNNSRTDREITFLFGEFRGEGKDAPRFVPSLDFVLRDGEGDVIDDRTLDKGDEATVTVTVPLTGDFGTPGNYYGTVVVQSHCTLKLHLCIKVTSAGAAFVKHEPKPTVEQGTAPEPTVVDERHGTKSAD